MKAITTLDCDLNVKDSKTVLETYSGTKMLYFFLRHSRVYFTHQKMKFILMDIKGI